MAQAVQKVIRDPGFAKRLDSACDGHPRIPALYKGRLTWFREEMEKRFGVVTSTETIRKWFAGEVKPRPEKIAMLAELLQVDVSWLQLGIDQHLAPRQKKVRSALVTGAVNLVAGLIQMDGGNIAFPDENDRRAQGAAVDFYAIIKGASYAFHVALGLIRDGMELACIEITDALTETYGVRRGAALDVVLEHDVMATLTPISTFSERL